MSTTTPNITATLQTMMDDIGVPMLLTLLAATGPVGVGIAAAFKIPLLGSLMTSILNSLLNVGIAKGVIEAKVGIIEFLDDTARTKYAVQLPLLQQYQAQQNMTPQEESDFDNAFQSAVQNHAGIINS